MLCLLKHAFSPGLVVAKIGSPPELAGKRRCACRAARWQRGACSFPAAAKAGWGPAGEHGREFLTPCSLFASLDKAVF